MYILLMMLHDGERFLIYRTNKKMAIPMNRTEEHSSDVAGAKIFSK